MGSILFIGCFPPPINGQSYATQLAYDGYTGNKLRINRNYEGKNTLSKLLSNIWLFIKLPFYFLFNNIDKVYFTCSVNKLGALRDVNILIWCIVFNVKSYTHLHGAYFKGFIENSPLPLKKLLIFCYSNLHTAIVLHEEIKEQFVFFEKVNIKTVHNFYDPNLDLPSIVKRVDKRIKIGFFSSIMYSKGITYLIDAFNQLSSQREYKNFVLEIAGPIYSDHIMSKNELKTYLEEAVSLNTNIIFHGLIQGTHKIDFLNRIDILVLPTFHPTEGVPISILEAMRCNTAIITTNHNYLRFIIDSPKKGILVPPKSTNDIINAIVELTQNPFRLDSIKSYNSNFAKQNYNVLKYQNNINKILNS